MDEDTFEEDTTFEDETTGQSGRGLNIFNILAVVLIVAALCVVGLLLIVIVTPNNLIADLSGQESEQATATLVATLAAPATFTSTPLPSDTPAVISLPPTNTPVPVGDTATPVPINTLLPTLTPSASATLPPPTPTKTATPTPTDTPTPGPTPTATSTRSAFVFTKDDVSPQYLQNFANAAGCNWMGIGGTVLDLNGNPVPTGEYQVHVWDSGIDVRAPVGGAPAYGPSGYEQFLFDAPRIQDNNVQLETVNGTAVSQVYRIQTRASCNQNLISFGFVQNH
ncbi:MAG TPA: hypothetical protein VMZ24_05125 [Patescibacteria group bacterium]|jgi:hypothetical protein|nr:hypothetical protein [Patescibacteria group bacterium]